MKLNNYDLKAHFHADVCSFAYQPLSPSTEFYFPDNSLSPIRVDKIMRPQERTLELDFWNSNDISAFTAELLSCDKCILDIDDGYIYVITYMGDKAPAVQNWNDYYTVAYTLYVIQTKDMITVSSAEFNVEGTLHCACIYEILAKDNLVSFSVDGITLKNLKANKKLIIDGINKLVYYKDTPELSEFDSTNIVNFPKLDTGIHKISKSDQTVEVVIKYYPIYI